MSAATQQDRIEAAVLRVEGKIDQLLQALAEEDILSQPSGTLDDTQAGGGDQAQSLDTPG